MHHLGDAAQGRRHRQGRFDIDPNQARRLLAQLERAGIVKQTSDGRRNRVWRVDQMFRLLDDHALGQT